MGARQRPPGTGGAERVILRCPLPRLDNPHRLCRGLVGGAPDGAIGVRQVQRVEDAHPGHYAMRCDTCGRYVEVRPPEAQWAA
jgi:hypothetical protein